LGTPGCRCQQSACRRRWRSTYPWRLLYFKTVANACSIDGERNFEAEEVVLSKAVMAFRHGVLERKKKEESHDADEVVVNTGRDGA
jgi:hypothetical protein